MAPKKDHVKDMLTKIKQFKKNKKAKAAAALKKAKQDKINKIKTLIQKNKKKPAAKSLLDKLKDTTTKTVSGVTTKLMELTGFQNEETETQFDLLNLN